MALLLLAYHVMREASEYHKVIVIGAGAAGLACAQRLQAAGADVLVLESRARSGGRLFSIQEAGPFMPLELGAEFVHGAPEVSFSCLTQAGISFYDLPDKHLLRTGQRLVKRDFFGKVEDFFGRLKKDKGSPRTAADFLKRQKDSPQDKDIFRSFVEGFHAADMNLIGQKALAAGAQGSEGGLNGISLFRPRGSYMGMIEALRKDVNLMLQTRVHSVEWKAGAAILMCRQGEKDVHFACDKLVVTLPIGVLKAPAEREGIAWNPIPKDLVKTLNAIEMGHVQKLILEFRSRFWESLSKEPVQFLHANVKHYFPTWWTMSPLRTPFLTAWQGGPKAQELADWPLERRVEKALETLAYLTRKPLKWLRQELKGVHTHNWSSDPNSFGAYSYVLRDGLRAAKLLSQAIENTLFFAGEGFCSSEPARGTVHGALESGFKVADVILQTIRI